MPTPLDRTHHMNVQPSPSHIENGRMQELRHIHAVREFYRSMREFEFQDLIPLVNQTRVAVGLSLAGGIMFASDYGVLRPIGFSLIAGMGMFVAPNILGRLLAKTPTFREKFISELFYRTHSS